MGLTCLVTIHGIGFQQPPTNDQPGYADNLHKSLKRVLGDRLSDDPEGSGPIYIQSCAENVTTDGLNRLSRPLVTEGADIAHVALVYSGLALEHARRFGSLMDALARTVVGFHDYATPVGAAEMLGEDLLALLHRSHPTPGLTPRVDITQPGVVHRMLPNKVAVHRPSALTVVIDDIACYVCRNDMRERLRAFIQATLETLGEHVDRIVLNTHSQGTVVGVDVLTRYSSDKIDKLVTAGSPLRKYVDLFQWGDHTGKLGERIAAGGLTWINVFDDKDPVADPLRPSINWKRGRDLPADDTATLFRVTNPAWCSIETTDCPVTDMQVNNVDNVTGGGLRAHAYWDNDKEFVPLLAGLL